MAIGDYLICERAAYLIQLSIYAISKILRDEIYTGTYHWGNPPNIVKLENAYPAIISQETFNQIQEIIASRAALHPRIIASDYLLSGLLTCGKCGWKLTASSTIFETGCCPR